MVASSQVKGGPWWLIPAPVDGQVLPDGHQQTGGPVLPDALVGPGRRRLCQLFIPGLQGEEKWASSESGMGVGTKSAATPTAAAPGKPTGQFQLL